MGQYDSHKDLKKMIDRYVAGSATEEEIRFIESYYDFHENGETPELSDVELEQLNNKNFKAITQRINTPFIQKRRTVRLYKYVSIAAVLILSGTAGYIFFKPNYKSPKSTYASHAPLDVAPGTNKAILQLADGRKIVLDNNTTGNVQQSAGLTITNSGKGVLIYTLSGTVKPDGAIANNTIFTPRGGQYQVILPDGSKVWLNAASSLTYPEVFTGNKRQVKLEGEGYFEVAKNKALPFHVITGNQDVEVTGTHFNINGYMDESSINTTLLEGGITVTSGNKRQKIVPGQMSMVFDSPPAVRIKLVNTDEEVAWKNGLFQFNNANLKSILGQLERWYDIKVDYNTIPQKRYNGMVPRSVNLSGVLKMLELTGNIRFTLENNRHLKVISALSSGPPKNN